MKRITLLLSAGVAALLFAPAGLGYDTGLAESFATLFQPVQGAKAGAALHLMKPEKLVARVRAGEPIVALDIRTPAEAGIFGMTLPGSLAIPLSELFTPGNLQRIPTDRPVVVVCKTGTFAAAATTALRGIGFDDVYVLYGGLDALAKYLNPNTANAPPAAEKR
jgi:rhodanese-related sulfurtransferase